MSTRSPVIFVVAVPLNAALNGMIFVLLPIAAVDASAATTIAATNASEILTFVTVELLSELCAWVCVINFGHACRPGPGRHQNLP